MKCFFTTALVLFIGCREQVQNTERAVFIQKLDALKFLSKYHDQLHVMIGEQDGNGDKAFKEFANALKENSNVELIPVKMVFRKIKYFNIASDQVMKLDYLVDYYQSGLSLQIEAILRGHGYFKTFPLDSALIIYNRFSDK